MSDDAMHSCSSDSNNSLFYLNDSNMLALNGSSMEFMEFLNSIGGKSRVGNYLEDNYYALSQLISIIRMTSLLKVIDFEYYSSFITVFGCFRIDLMPSWYMLPGT